MHTLMDLFSDEFWLRPADSLLLFQLLAVFHPQLAPVVQCLIDRSGNDLLKSTLGCMYIDDAAIGNLQHDSNEHDLPLVRLREELVVFRWKDM